jgi:uncharacterized repeat protein (TIGR02543 family)
MLVWYGRSKRRQTLMVLLLLFLGSITALRYGVRETVESQPPDVELRFRMPNGEEEIISSRWPLEYDMPAVDPPEGKVFVHWYLDEALTTRFETNITPLSHRTFFPRFDALQQEIRFIDTYGITYGRIYGPVGSPYLIPTPPDYYGLKFTGYDVELPQEIPINLLLVRALYSPMVQMITLKVGDTDIEVEFDQNQTILTTLIEDQLTPPDGFDYVGLLINTEEEEVFVPAGQSSPIPDGAQITPVYEPSTYRIRFNTVGATIRDIVREFEELIGTLPNPQRSNYSFDGWFEDVNLTTLFARLTMPAMDLELFAKWTFLPSSSPATGPVAPIIVTDPPPSSDPVDDPDPDPEPVAYLYEFVDREVVIASGMLLAGEAVPNPPVVEPTSGIRFNGWSPDVPVTMPSSNQTFVAQYVTLYTLTIVYNDEAGTEEVVELAEGEEHNFASDTTFELMSVETNDDVIFQTLFATQTFVVQPLSDDPPPPAIDAFHEDPQLKTNVIPINSGIVMPASDKILYARWNFKVTVEINDPFESGLVLGSGMYFPGQELTEEDFPPLVDAVGYSGLTWSIDGYRVPRVLPTVPQPTVPRRTLVPFLYQLHIGSGQIAGQSGVIQIERFRGSGLNLPKPELSGYIFEDYYASSDFSDSGVTDYVLDINRLRGRSNIDPFSYYAKWTQLQLADYTIAFYDSGLNMITSGTFQSKSTIELATPALESVENYVASWKESGHNRFTVPTIMPFNDLDFIPYYEFSFPVVNSLIGQAVLNGEFNNLSIPPGSTDIMVVSGIIQNLLMSSGTLPLNISFDVTLSGARLNTDGNNTYIISLSGLFQGTDSLSIDTSFVYDDEFKVQNSVKETIDILEDNPTYNVGISETDGATMTGFLFPNSSESTLTTCLNVVGGLIKNELTFTGITVQVTPTLPKPIKSPVKFTITISIGNPVSRSQSLERWVYWNIGGNTFNC